MRAVGRAVAAARAAGHVDAQLERVAVLVDNQVEIRQQQGAGRGELDIGVLVAEGERPGPTLFRSVSMAPKYDGVTPNVPVHRFTWNGNHPRPSTAMRPLLAKAIAGSLLPDEFACGDEVKPAGVAGEMSRMLEKAEEEARAPAQRPPGPPRRRWQLRPPPRQSRPSFSSRMSLLR